MKISYDINDVHSRKKVKDEAKIKNGTYVINIDKYESIKTHWIALCVNNNNVTYFDSFENEYIPK